jgi:hypothetical protein
VVEANIHSYGIEGGMYDVVVCDHDYGCFIIRFTNRYQAKEKRERPARTGDTPFYQTW